MSRPAWQCAGDPDDDPLDALAATALDDLLRHGRASLGAFGTMAVRTVRVPHPPHPRLPLLRFSARVYDFVRTGGRRPPSLAGPLGDAVERARAGEVTPLGVLGELQVLHRSMTVPLSPIRERVGSARVRVIAIRLITFRSSQQARRLLDGHPVTPVPSELVDHVLEHVPLSIPPPVRDADALIGLLARAYPGSDPCIDPELRAMAQAEHEAMCARVGNRPGVVFACDPDAEPDDGDHWALGPEEPDPLVFRTRGHDEPPIRLSAWLGEHHFLAALRQLAGERFLTAPDWRRVVAHVDRAVPGFARRPHGLPF